MRERQGLGIAATLAVAVFAFLMYIAPQYGYTGDELYFLDCAQHPAWGYVDLPPLVPWLGWLVRHSLGTSLYAIRLLPALAAAATVLLTALLAREFGGRRRAIISAAILVAFAPVVLAFGHLFMTNVFDLPLWTGCVLLLVRIEKSNNPRWWLLFGPLVGVSLLNKYGIVFFLLGLLLGTCLTAWRRWFASGWFWAGILVAVGIALPNFIWQAEREFPFLQLMRTIRAHGRDVVLPPLQFVLTQMMITNVFSFVFVIAGILFFFTAAGRRFRALGWTYLGFTLLLMILRGKSYYLGAVYPMMFAAGAVGVERWCVRPWSRRGVAAYLALPVLLACVFMPLIVPVLPVEMLASFQQRLFFQPPETEHHARAPVPDLYADMFGLRETAELVANYYNSLPPETRSQTAIFTGHFAEAGAIDLFGPALGLPPAISGHQNYWLWGPHGYTGKSIIAVGPLSQYFLQNCASLSVVAERHHPFARPDRNSPIYLCRDFKFDLSREWWRLRHWD